MKLGPSYVTLTFPPRSARRLTVTTSHQILRSSHVDFSSTFAETKKVEAPVDTEHRDKHNGTSVSVCFGRQSPSNHPVVKSPPPEHYHAVAFGRPSLSRDSGQECLGPISAI